MAGFTSDIGNYLSICLYVQIVLLVLGGRYLNDGTTLAVALGLTAVHGGMLELLHTFIVLCGVLLPVDLYVAITGGLTGWLWLFLVLIVVTRVGCIWFGYTLAQQEKGEVCLPACRALSLRMRARDAHTRDARAAAELLHVCLPVARVHALELRFAIRCSAPAQVSNVDPQILRMLLMQACVVVQAVYQSANPSVYIDPGPDGA